MLKIHRVLHATDFSPSSRSAMEYSMLLGRLLKVPVDVLHVVPGVGPHRIEAVADLPQDGDPNLRERWKAVREAAEASPNDTRMLIGYGPLPGPVVIEEAHRGGTNLIVLGAHGGGEAEENKLGSVSTDVVRRSTCPVLIVPPHVQPEAVDAEMERVVTFVSYAHLIEPVVAAAAHMAELFGARLDVLTHVGGTDAGHPAPRWEDVEENLRQIIRRHKERDRVTLPSDRIEVHALRGDPVEEILRFTSEQASDLLIIEAPGLASMDSPSEQAVEDLVGRAPCPVILINTCGRSLTRPSRRRNQFRMTHPTV